MNAVDFAIFKHFKQGEDPDTERFDPDANGKIIYAGFAKKGSLSSAAVWRIFRFTYNSNDVVTAIESSGHNAVWDDRATISFS